MGRSRSMAHLLLVAMVACTVTETLAFEPALPLPTPTSGPFTGDPEQHPNRQLLPDPAQLHCGASKFTIKIAGGGPHLGEYPWLAALGYERAGAAEVDFNCGGALINDQYVLTAAHCVTGLPSELKLAKIRLGEHNRSSELDCFFTQPGVCAGPVEDFEPVEIIPHADYNSPERFWNDIALIRLNRPYNKTIDSTIQPICLPFGNFDKPLEDKKLVVAGFGLTQPFDDSSEVMMKVDVPLFNATQCGQVFRRNRAKIGSTQLCAGGARGQDSCSGDSGGPLMATTRFGPPPNYVVGVRSFGVTRCGTKNVPGVYTRVSSYLNWIMDTMRQ